MPNDSINIYIDSTFSTTSDGEEDVSTELTLAEADVIGAKNVPIVYNVPTTAAGSQKIDVEYFRVISTTSGFVERDVEYFSSGTTSTSGVYVCLVDYSFNGTISGSSDAYIDCFLVGYTGLSGVPTLTPGFKDALIDYIAGQKFDELDINIPVSFWKWLAVSGSESFLTQYTHLDATNTAINRTAYITFGSEGALTSGSQQADVDITFAGWVNYPLLFDLYCALEDDTKYIESDLTVISGTVDQYIADIVCAVSGTTNFISDVYCCLIDYEMVDFETEVRTGSIDKFNWEVHSCAEVKSSLSFDVDLLSLKISNFIPAEDEYISADGVMSVDITDDVYNVLTSASGITCSGTCCLQVDGTAVPVTFSGITDGYRMYYNPSDDFSSLTGSTEFLVRAENSNGDVLERSYYLTYGYLMSYDNQERFGFDYGYNTQVVVRMSAEDWGICPKFSADAYYFTTEQRRPVDLGINIVGIPGTVEKDLNASIYPRSTAFFYGKTFRVVLRAKDFLGNEMEPYEFEFKIEDAPED